jgi:hypothetical protein
MVFARTPAEDLAAYLMLFKAMDAHNYYWDVLADTAEWYEKAKQGDEQAAKNLLCVRSDEGYEYETIEVERIDTPPAPEPAFMDPSDPATIPPHIVELATTYGKSPEHTQELLNGYLRGDTISVELSGPRLPDGPT